MSDKRPTGRPPAPDWSHRAMVALDESQPDPALSQQFTWSLACAVVYALLYIGYAIENSKMEVTVQNNPYGGNP